MTAHISHLWSVKYNLNVDKEYNETDLYIKKNYVSKKLKTKVYDETKI